MGYTTDFTGDLTISPPLTPDQAMYLKQFNETRRMRRDEKIAATLSDPLRVAVGLPIGVEGGYFVGGAGFSGQDHDASVLDGNTPPTIQPGLWCGWTVTDDGSKLKWDGCEKFYSYVEWLEYLIQHFYKPWGRTLNGQIIWHGEESEDVGAITVVNNTVHAEQGEPFKPSMKDPRK